MFSETPATHATDSYVRTHKTEESRPLDLTALYFFSPLPTLNKLPAPKTYQRLRVIHIYFAKPPSPPRLRPPPWAPPHRPPALPVAASSPPPPPPLAIPPQVHASRCLPQTQCPLSHTTTPSSPPHPLPPLPLWDELRTWDPGVSPGKNFTHFFQQFG